VAASSFSHKNFADDTNDFKTGGNEREGLKKDGLLTKGGDYNSRYRFCQEIY